MVASSAVPVAQSGSDPTSWMAAKLAELEREVAELRRLAPSSLNVQIPGSAFSDARIYADPTLKWPDGTPFVWVILKADNRRWITTFPVNQVGNTVNTSAFALFNPMDTSGIEVFSTDATSGVGIAKPYLAIPMYRCFIPSSTIAAANPANGAVFSYASVSSTAPGLAQGSTLWQGDIPLVTHPKLALNMLVGQASGTITPTYTVKLNGTTIDTFTPGFTTVNRVIDVTAFMNLSRLPLNVNLSWTGAGGVVACDLTSCYLRQT